MAFWRRTSAPSQSDRNFINTSYGGRNRCIKIQSNGFVMPNCTGYVHGRWLEMYNESNLSIRNAHYYWGNTSDGYRRGQTPVLGAVICWGDDTSSHSGHVAIVEYIYPDGRIITSNSAYGSTNWYQQTLSPPYRYQGSHPEYYFQGFIYPPDYNPDVPGYIKDKTKWKWLLYTKDKRFKRLHIK